MLRNEARVGMKVIFVTSNGERILGEIVKINPKRAKVVQISEEHGSRQVFNVGTIWVVPYNIMEKAESVTGEKIIPKPPKQNSVVTPGMTFTAPYADSNSLWKVLSKRGHDVWLCQIISNPGEEEFTDWVGQIKTFLTSEILSAISIVKLFANAQDEQKKFYDNLTLGTIVHYHKGHKNWVRCEVVTNEKDEKVLLPIALVGDWKSWDLPRRNQDGSIFYGYYVDKILKKETFSPNSKNIWENHQFRKNGHQNPQEMVPINFELPPMSSEETRVANMWKKLFEIKNLIQNNQNPEELLNKIRSILNN